MAPDIVGTGHTPRSADAGTPSPVLVSSPPVRVQGSETPSAARGSVAGGAGRTPRAGTIRVHRFYGARGSVTIYECGGCGAVVRPDDLACPACGEEFGPRRTEGAA